MASIDSKIIGASSPAVNLKKLVTHLAESDSPVIIYGPTGSGKELVAEALHSESRRKGKFIALNCAAIPHDLIEAELFGYEKGAFTGAVSSTPGKFEQANGGTIFLDEIGDMPQTLQIKLLRVLEKPVVSRIGGKKETTLSIRIVCATHKNLEELVRKNEFREDLLFRLAVFPINVPSLSERTDDIPALFTHFVNLKTKNNGKNPPALTEDAYQTLKEYSWPGNIRELRNVVERAITFFPSKILNGSDVEKFLLKFNQAIIDHAAEQATILEEFDKLAFSHSSENETKSNNLPDPQDFANWFDTNNVVDLRSFLRDIEITFIKAAMKRNNDNTSEAAKDLKLLRTTLIEKIRKYGI
jgi:sigma-54 specific flagellar transcriptional regulator A